MPISKLLTPAVHAAIVESIRGGNYIDMSAAAAGICRKTFYNWMHLGEADDATEPYLSFASDVRKAEAESEADAVKVLHAAKYEDWKASEVFLKRRFPKRWGDKVESNVDATIKVEASPTEAARLVREAFGEHAAKATDGSDPDPEPGA